MILSPLQLSSMNRAMKTPATESDLLKLKKFITHFAINEHVVVSIPEYWADTVLGGLTSLKMDHPNVLFASVTEQRGRLRIVTVPAYRAVTHKIIDIYNRVDNLILQTVDRFAKSEKKPFFLNMVS